MATVHAGTTTAVGEQQSRFTLRHLSALLVVLALFVTGYMTYNKLVGQPMICVETGMINCAKVENSAWAWVGPVPTAMLGLIAHLMIGSILILETRVSFFRDNAPLLLFGLTFFCILYHSYLIYVSVFILQALCLWCLAAASIMFMQFFISVIRFKRYLAT